MSSKNNRVAIVILAAGKGKRMQSDLPKVMHLLKGKPLIDHVVTNISYISKPVLIVSGDDLLVRKYFGDRVHYAVQERQLGTGHAVACAENKVNGFADHVIVLYGDMPFVSGESIEKLITEHTIKDNETTLMTVILPDFIDWRHSFYDFGRIVRDEDGNIKRIVEKKDATAEELNITEVNPSYFCFKSEWLWSNLKKINNNNAQNEYYLTDLVKLAIDNGCRLSSVDIDPKEALGVNTKEDFELANVL